MFDLPVTPLETTHTAGTQLHPSIRPYHKATKVHSLRRAAQPVFVRVDFHPAGCQERPAFPPPAVECGAIRAEEDEVIHVAHISRHAQPLLHEVIEAIQMDVREKLAGQVADRQAVRLIREVEKLFPMPNQAHSVAVAGEDLADELHHPGIADHAGN